MNKWVYRILMGLLWSMIMFGIFDAVTTKPPQEMCLAGIVMVQDKGGDWWVQKGLFPTHCVQIDKD
jgi:hypothetical protein